MLSSRAIRTRPEAARLELKRPFEVNLAIGQVGGDEAVPPHRGDENGERAGVVAYTVLFRRRS
jgi:hypothetical protein